MAYVSIQEAAKLTGKSIQSLYRHVNNGRVSRHDDGFDIAELMRVYGPLRNTGEIEVDVSFNNERLQMLGRENEILRRNAEQLLNDKQILYDIIKKLESDKDKLYGIIDDYKRQLPAPTEVTTKKTKDKHSLWQKIFKKSGHLPKIPQSPALKSK
jgi:hypothetical protein